MEGHMKVHTEAQLTPS